MLSSLFQDEKYIHIDEAEMSKVEKCVSDTMQWISNVVSAQAKLSLEQDPVVSVNEIKGKLRVRVTSFSHLIAGK